MTLAIRSRRVIDPCRLQRDSRDPGARIGAQHGIDRSSRWPAVERAHLAKEPMCVACLRESTPVQVHHILPFHFCIALGRPDLELDERNLITLCGEGERSPNHHLLLGHLDDWQSMNSAVHVDAATKFHGWSAIEIRADHAWRDLAARRPLHLDENGKKREAGAPAMDGSDVG